MTLTFNLTRSAVPCLYFNYVLDANIDGGIRRIPTSFLLLFYVSISSFDNRGVYGGKGVIEKMCNPDLDLFIPPSSHTTSIGMTLTRVAPRGLSSATIPCCFSTGVSVASTAVGLIKLTFAVMALPCFTVRLSVPLKLFT
ncbi:hypothetical protein SPFM1_00106 [Salmonella phage SPFM1]|nr:hypothetical protein SPFM1_00106 [Salmonella phage SPFM1]